MTEFAVLKNIQPQPELVREDIKKDPGFGQYFTDHMAHIRYTNEDGWQAHQVEPYGPIVLDPAAAVFHYAQEIFEGLKAYRHADGSVWTFRPDRNAVRINRSAERLALPQLSEEDFINSLKALVSTDEAWVPTPGTDGDESSLYLRPFMIASERFLGVRASHEVDYYVIASPAGPYFAGGIKPVSIWLSKKLNRAGSGGTGFAKCGGNYASSLLAQQEAADNGCQQVLFTDAEEHKYIDELGGMNLMLVTKDGKLLTPELSDTILDGVTRRSLLDLAPDLGLEPVERPITIDEWREGAENGDIVEAFACGTAAVITPIGKLVSDEFTIDHGDEPGEKTMALRKALLDIQYGRAEDKNNWLVRLA
ncbi:MULTISPECIES: branched-chain amino acid aminotransferase [unclassified Brevibacterium]|uniref:branched-chain amino acid aminotransferase n=1 Tax=unclassified Brevibacterium TaxID=2614124 RepID=UPI0010F4A9B6|nr:MULTISPECIES: branched-chain amino acid aminotransferase [unclassified Brevibacterium]MCM1012014.1 branched-chain amino acid aminotransferase [Brevibacterium sp. XM4083]